MRRGMEQHASNLRIYYLAIQRRLAPGNKVDLRWSESFVVEWMKTLRIPPYQSAYECRPRGSACARCVVPRGASPSACTECVFPGGARMRCQTCGSVWLEDERPLATTSSRENGPTGAS
jgi:hypothetical protein